MGVTPIACVAPPRPSREELFRREITPPPDRFTPVLGWIIVLLVMALIGVVLGSVVA